MLYDLQFSMSDLITFVTGLCIGLASAFVLKGRAKEVPKEIKATTKLLKTAIKDRSEYKMVFVVRNDLGMTKGKIASQCAHATLSCYKIALENCPENVKLWNTFSGQAKIALKLDDKDGVEILKMAKRADELGIVNAFIRDAGRTQIEKGTITVLGLGPSPVKLIDAVSGHLKLL